MENDEEKREDRQPEEVREMVRELEDKGVTVVYAQEPQQCDMCGEIKELRPYGPKGEAICYECATSTPEMRASSAKAMKRTEMRASSRKAMKRKFRKKPVVIEAIRFLDATNDYPTAQEFCPDLSMESRSGKWFYFIETLEGQMQVSADDWIIKGVAGEFYPCKPDIFQATYEAVD